MTRNEPLEIFCESCEKRVAANICSAHWGDDDSYFCETCYKKHETVCAETEDYWMPVVNSPRMGECGYDGGTIDTERDGIFKIKA